MSVFTFDDESAKVGNTTIGNVAHDAQGEEEVELDIGKCLPNLIGLSKCISRDRS